MAAGPPEKKPKWAAVRLTLGAKPRLARVADVLAVLAIEVTDVVFAIDSVPAVLGVTHDTFIVYTSNIFAILGLRSLYFVLQSLLHRLHLLHYGLAAILVFVGGKMMATRWFEVPTLWSLLVILVTVAISAAASLLLPERTEHSTPQQST